MNTLIPHLSYNFNRPFGLINALLGNPQPVAEDTYEVAPRYFLDETDTHYTITVDLPGVAKEAITVDVENNTLTIKADRTVKQRSVSTQIQYVKSFAIPQTITSAHIEAKTENGVLTVSVKKPDVVPKSTIKIA